MQESFTQRWKFLSQHTVMRRDKWLKRLAEEAQEAVRRHTERQASLAEKALALLRQDREH